MSKITVSTSDPAGTQSVSSSTLPDSKTFTLTYSNSSVVFGFRGPNSFPPVNISMFINRSLAYPLPRGEVKITLFDGTVITYSFFTGFIDPVVTPSPPRVTSNTRPLRIRRARTNVGPPLLIIEKDITVNDRNQIVAYDPSNITNTLVYSFQIEYSAGIFFDTLYFTPILSSNVSNVNDSTGDITYKIPIMA